MKIESVTLSFVLLLQIYIYAWPADHMKDMVNYILYKYIILKIYKNIIIYVFFKYVESFIFLRV